MAGSPALPTPLQEAGLSEGTGSEGAGTRESASLQMPRPLRDRLLLRKAELLGGAQSLRSAIESRPPHAQLCSGGGPRRGWGGAWRGVELEAPGPPTALFWGWFPSGHTGAALAARHGRAAGTGWPGGKSGCSAAALRPLAPGNCYLLCSTALGPGLVPPGSGRPAAAHGPQGLSQPPGMPPHIHSDPDPQVTERRARASPNGRFLHCTCPKRVTSGVPEFSDP